jgi:hypothetical protein
MDTLDRLDLAVPRKGLEIDNWQHAAEMPVHS